MPRAKMSQAVRDRGQALGHEVRRVRSESAMSAEQVAVEAALSVETIRRIEQGRIPNPGVFTVAAIAAALDVGLAGLVEAATAHGESR
ncbi:MAG: helix-turn-helix domain-containing protein [Microthrixaceae bacterium]